MMDGWKMTVVVMEEVVVWSRWMVVDWEGSLGRWEEIGKNEGADKLWTIHRTAESILFGTMQTLFPFVLVRHILCQHEGEMQTLFSKPNSYERDL